MTNREKRALVRDLDRRGIDVQTMARTAARIRGAERRRARVIGLVAFVLGIALGAGMPEAWGIGW